MKQKYRAIRIVFLSLIGMLILFMTVTGIGNYFQNIGQKIVGNSIMLLFPILTYFAVKIFNQRINRINPDSYGFNFKSLSINVLIGILLALLIMTFSLIIASLLFEISIEFSGLKKGFLKPLTVLIMTLAVIGIWEEFYFRGLVYNTLLKTEFGFQLSALFSSIIFSIVHWSIFDMTETSWLYYISIVFGGYILAFIYTITNSIWSVVSFHFVWNFMARILDPQENKIGIIEIHNYTEHTRTIEGLLVITLGLVLIVVLFLTRKKTVLEKINSYIKQITTANKG